MGEDGGRAPVEHVSLRTALAVLVRAPDSYGLVLALLIVSFILAPIAEGTAGLWTRVCVQGVTVLFALHTSRVHRRTLRGAMALVVTASLIAFAGTLRGTEQVVVGRVEVLLAVLLGISVPAMLRRILTSKDVGIEIVIGALDVYIIFGMFFSAVYAAIGDLSSTPFFVGEPHLTLGSYQFFSFVTLTTVGYGNLVPATSAGQSLAVMEALVGQVYLVTLVARLVSGLQPGTRRQALRQAAAERERARQGAVGPIPRNEKSTSISEETEPVQSSTGAL